MAEIIDQRDPELQDGEEFGNIEELGVAPEPEIEELEDSLGEEEITTTEPEIPAKFKGKSIEDIVHSYTELEREYGRRSNEVGELRKLTDEILKSSLQVDTGGTTAKKKTEVDDLLENPDQVIEDVVSNSPKLKQLEEQLINARREEARKGFEAKHPNAYDIVQDTTFQKWVAASPVRQQMFLDAHQNYNYEVASELIGLYEQVVQTEANTVKEDRKAKRSQSLKDATTEKGSSGQSSKKIFRRTDVLKMIRTNPKKYNDPAFQAELAAAYQEGRVR